MPACTLSGEIEEIAALMPPDDLSPFASDDEADDEDDESDDGVDDWLDDDAPRPLLPSEPVLPAAELMFDDDDCEPIDEDDCDDGEPGAEPEVDEPVLPRLPLDEALCWLDDDGDELVLLRFDDALCWLPDEAVVPLFRLESWLLPMLEPALLASMPLPSVDF
jgi:hypothetical protein